MSADYFNFYFEASWTYDSSKLNLTNHFEKADTSNFIQHGEWNLVDVLLERNEKHYSCCSEPFPDVTYYIVIKRRPHFYVYNMILPCMLLTFVALFGFLVPPGLFYCIKMFK